MDIPDLDATLAALQTAAAANAMSDDGVLADSLVLPSGQASTGSISVRVDPGPAR